MRINPTFNVNFKSKNAVVGNLAKAAQKMNIGGGSDEEKAKTLLSQKKDFEILGYGGTSVVYKIPYTQYAFRVSKSNPKDMAEFRVNLPEQQKLNNVVAIDSKNNCKILKLIEGLHSQSVFRTHSVDDYVEIVNSLPQKAYDEYLDKCVQVHLNNLFFDNYGDNMIIDIKNQRFEPIDMIGVRDCTNYKVSTNPLKFNPIECMFFGVYNTLSVDDYFVFLAKCAKSLAKDCKYFEYFDYKIDSSNKIEKNEYMRKISRSLYAYLIKLHNNKMFLKEQGLNENQIKDILKSDIEKFTKVLDKHTSQEDDLTIEEMLEIKDKIEKRPTVNTDCDED